MRSRIAAAVAAGALALGLAACGLVGDRTTETSLEFAEAVSPEVSALAALGFEQADLGIAATGNDTTAMGEPSSAASPAPRVRRPAARHAVKVFLRRNMLHGEVVVQTENGTRTVVAQRGTITAIDDTSVTVKSADGYTLTWMYGNPLRVIERRTTIQPNRLSVGAEVGVAGATADGKTMAHLVVVPLHNSAGKKQR